MHKFVFLQNFKNNLFFYYYFFYYFIIEIEECFINAVTSVYKVMNIQ